MIYIYIHWETSTTKVLDNNCDFTAIAPQKKQPGGPNCPTQLAAWMMAFKHKNISWHSHHSHGQRSESNGIHGSYWIISTSAITGHHRPSAWLRLIAPTGPTLHVHIDPDRAVAAAAHGGPLSFSFTPAALAVGNGIAMEVRTLRVETRHDILRRFQAA